MPEALTTRDFLPHLHTQFEIEQFESYKLELTEVTEYSNTQLEQFSLFFTGTASLSLQQGMYKLIHPQMGECELFLVPIGPDGANMRYEAAFSRFIRTSGS
ncbi:MAG: hypothetical protein WBX22_28535 [Silvibacterium sp.]